MTTMPSNKFVLNYLILPVQTSLIFFYRIYLAPSQRDIEYTFRYWGYAFVYN